MTQQSYGRRTRLTRRGRLVRSAALFVFAIIVIALIVGKLGGGTKEPPTPTVSFVVGSLHTQSEGPKPSSGASAKDQADIKALFDDWFQTAFVDPKKYGDGSFSDIADRFVKEARAQFKTDIPTLTIGDARTDVKRVTPTSPRLALGIYYADGKPTFATARVTFSAIATLKEKAALPLRIVFTGDFTLEKQGGDWVVSYYKASQTQNSIQPSPSASASR